MGLNLEKGQKVELTKGTGIKTILVGLGWDAAAPGGAPIDVDAMAFLLNKDGKCASIEDFVYYGMQKLDQDMKPVDRSDPKGRLIHKSGSVLHSGDNLTGAGAGDDELITIELDKVPATIEKIVLAIAIYEASKRNQNFGMVKNAFVHVTDAVSKQEVLKYDLTEDYSVNVSVIVGEIYRHNGEWKFGAIGTGTKDEIAGLAKTYGLS